MSEPQGFCTARDLVLARRELRRLEARGQRHDTTQADGTRLRWRHWGADGRPPLVLLHGGHGSWMHWARNVEALAASHSVWVPDMPGFGDSDALPGHPYDPNRQTRLIDALDRSLRQLIGEQTKFDLAGFSFGGLVAAQWAAGPASRRVRRLGLLGVAGHGGERPLTTELKNWRALSGAARWRAHADNLALFMLHDTARIDAQAVVLHADSSLATRYRSKAISRDARLPDILTPYRGELLLLWGEHDVTAHPHVIGAPLLQGRPERRLRILPGAGHWLPYELDDITNPLLLDWFQHGILTFP